MNNIGAASAQGFILIFTLKTYRHGQSNPYKSFDAGLGGPVPESAGSGPGPGPSPGPIQLPD